MDAERNPQHWWQWRERTLVLQLKLQPRSSKEQLGEPLAGRLKVHVTAPPADGAANDRLLRLLAKSCGVPRSAVRIAAGAKSREKTIEIHDPRRLPPPLDTCEQADQADQP
ncbi:hypothetical protein CKO15_08790 [Halorhodospira abdelmalekii]|uniref:DUF167 domain-containing protein n=1 Tax=Halorhodospira abdelmalekii TaxID=421629 RepID=UPI001908F415|nr:DUF167 domain-containing protein [Halorhodospira abdelmalekii]MBK1735377.1 hypothetical protein [Halorhodospira abdelmalekii]